MDQVRRSRPAELFAVIILGILLRLFAGRNSFSENGMLLPGYDEYYHMRRILFTANHFPDTLWFDSYLDYPKGLEITWPPLFDQLSSAFVLALGQHTKAGIETAASFFPVIIGMIAIVVVYLMVRELFDHRAALLAALMASLAPYYMLYTMIASLDHHCLEVLLYMIIILFLIRSICSAERRYVYVLVAGVAMAALAYTWQGAALYLAVLPVYALIQMSFELRAGRSGREIGSILLAAFAVAFVLMLPFRGTAWLSPSFLGAGAMLAGLALMLVLSQIITSRKLSWIAFPSGVALGALAFAAVAWLSGGLLGIGSVVQFGLEYIWGGGMIGKIGEAEPLIYNAETFSQVAFSMLGLNILLSIAGIFAAIRLIKSRSGASRQALTLYLIWLVYAIVLTFGQTRFLYISTISMGLLICILYFAILDWIVARNIGHEASKTDADADSDSNAPRGAASSGRALALLLLVLLVLPTAWDAVSFANATPPTVKGDWMDSLLWLKENSPATGYFDSAQERPEYGVMNWWDYGNWILYISERPVVSNNFQSGVEDSAKFYFSESEEDAEALIDSRGSRYVFTDYTMMYNKISSLTNWAGLELSDYITSYDEGSDYYVAPKERLFNTTLAKLYLFDGSSMGGFRLIYESNTLLGDNPRKSYVKIFEHVPGASIHVRAGPDQKVGALVNMTTNQGREFIYVTEARKEADGFSIRVPYSTDNNGLGCHATTPYLVFSGNEKGVRSMNLNVSEEDVTEGRSIEVSL